MHALFFLLLLCSSIGYCALSRLKPVRLEILDQNFVRLLVGNPPRHHLFYVDLSSSEIVLHDQGFELHSHSIELPVPSRGSELFYFDAYTLRLPFVYAAPSIGHTVRLVSSFSASGSLGLGAWSPLWLHWDNFSLSQQSLLLGGYDIYNQLDSTQRPPVFPNGAGLCSSLQTDISVPFHVDFGQLDTQLPAQLFEESPKQLHLEGASCRELYQLLSMHDAEQCSDTYTIPFHVQEISLLTGVSYRAVQHSHDGRVHFGKRFLEDFVLFCDFKEDMLLFAESSSSFFVSESNALFVVLLLFAGWTWILLTFGAHKTASSSETLPRSRLHRWVLLYTEGFLYAAIIISWTVNFVGFKWRRFVRSFQQQDSEFFLVYHNAVILICASIGLLRIATTLLCRTHCQRSRSSSSSLPSLVLLTNSLLPMLWSCFLPQHRYSSDLIFLVFFATALCVGNGVVTLYLAVHRRLLGLVALVPLTALAYYALIWGNLLPIHNTLGVLQGRLVFVGSYLAVVCAFTTAYTASRILLSEAKQQTDTAPASMVETVLDPGSVITSTTANKALAMQMFYFSGMGQQE